MTMHQALISVSDKQGVVEFGKALAGLGIKIISSGGTAKTFAANSVPCREISEITGFPEILDGRVKTLHPKVHGGILARRDTPAHLAELKKLGIEPVDIVVVNLYPFEQTIEKMPDDPAKPITDDVVENIDIGGVTLIRAAAKNFNDVLIVCDPADYGMVIEQIKSGSISPAFRRELAAKAFRHTAYYDALISGYFTTEKFPQEGALPLKRQATLRYGENPHQEAALYRSGPSHNRPFVVSARQLQGKELSYNNYLDLESAWKLVHEFDRPACAVIKHNNPCGCAEADNLTTAWTQALACDPVSAYGGILAFNRPVDDATAAEISKLFVECIIAPAYSPEALKAFSAKKNLRVLEQPAKPAKQAAVDVEYRALAGGFLAQDRDNALLVKTTPATNRKPTDEETNSLLFAWKVCKHVKSNAIILVRGTRTMGIGAGQMSRIDSVKIATEKMKDVKHDAGHLPLVLASDAFFPFPDVVQAAAAIGVTAIIHPGGSIRDELSVTAANEANMAMLFTGMRHFRH